jgi:hypothetical protein
MPLHREDEQAGDRRQGEEGRREQRDAEGELAGQVLEQAREGPVPAQLVERAPARAAQGPAVGQRGDVRDEQRVGRAAVLVGHPAARRDAGVHQRPPDHHDAQQAADRHERERRRPRAQAERIPSAR